MNPKIKARWVKALRSGEYEKGRGVLKQDGKYCCLGVLCEIAVADGVIEERILPDTAVNFGVGPSGSYGWSTTSLPRAVRDWAGLHATSPGADTEFGYQELATLNDGNDIIPPQTFEYIADVIERSL